jgi:Ca-activated chloride channel family protein
MPRTARRTIPRRGYVMLLVGILIGASIFALINLLFPSTTGGTGHSGVPDRIEFEFLYTSEKQSWIQEMTPEFEGWFKNRFGIDVRVRLTVMGSHQTVDEIIRGSKPVAWSPASSLWIGYLNYKWNETGHSGAIAQDWFPLVISPTVLCTWESFARRYDVKGFSDLYRLAKEGKDFKFGHPDPQLSNGGVTTLIMMFAEAANKSPDNLTVQDVIRPEVKDFVKTIESKSVYYGSSTGFFGAWAVENGPTALDVAGVYENVVLENSYKARSKWNDSLIAIYPSSGVLLNDHPFVILNGDWVDHWQRFAATQYLLFLLGEKSQERAQEHGFRPANPRVPVDTNVFNEGNGVLSRLDSLRILRPPSGEVLNYILSLWVEVRAGGM